MPRHVLISMLRLSLLTSLVTLLSACASVESIKPEPVELSTTFDSTAQSDKAFNKESNKWWLNFDDQLLTQLVSQALKENFQIKAALARFKQSRAFISQQSAGKIPSLDASLKKSRSWSESSDSGSTVSTTTDQWQASLTTSYELDFWGRVDALTEQAQFQSLSQQQAYHVMQNSVASQVVLSWYGIRRQQISLNLLQQQLLLANNNLKAIRLRQQHGLLNVSDIWQQQQQVESLASEIYSGEISLKGLQQQLALWLGQAVLSEQQLALFTPDKSAEADYYLLPAGQQLINSLPSQVLLNRPDVQQSFYLLQANNAALASAVANRYPRFTISASITDSQTDFANLFDNWLANLAGNLVLPIIDGDNRRAQVRSQEAKVDEALAAYQQTLLNAAQETEQALRDEKSAFSQQMSSHKQLLLADKNKHYQKKAYLKGATSYLQFSTAQNSYFQLAQQELQAQWGQLQARVQVYKAISSGDVYQTESSDK